MSQTPRRPLFLSKRQTASAPRRGEARIAIRGLLSAFALAWVSAGCALSGPLYVESKYAPETPPGAGSAVMIERPLDARHFTTSDSRAPVPSLRGDPQDAELTARVLGRMPQTEFSLGPNVTLPPGQTVSGWIQKALVEGFREAGLNAEAASNEGDTDTASAPSKHSNASAALSATVVSFWLNVRNAPGPSVVVYRADIEITGDLPRFREGRTVTATGSVSQIGLDYALFRKSFDAALKAIAGATAQAAVPGTPLP